MKIFLSWSGNQSLLLAKALREWLPFVFQGIETPFVSEKDIEAGEFWPERLSNVLENYDFGIVCLTTSNLTKPYIMFESGALAKKVGKARLIPVLCGVTPSDLVDNPLGFYQAVSLDRKGILKLVESINVSRLDSKLDGAVLEKTFDRWWSDLQAKIDTIVKAPDEDAPIRKAYTVDDMRGGIDEILSLLRPLARSIRTDSLLALDASLDLASDARREALDGWQRLFLQTLVNRASSEFYSEISKFVKERVPKEDKKVSP